MNRPPDVPEVAWRMCSSPIEQAMLIGLLVGARNLGAGLRVAVTRETAGEEVLVVPQWTIGGHKVDFLVAAGGVGIVVECDGKRDHRRPGAHEHDRAIDRMLQRQGYRVYRFTGEEIWHSAGGCAETVIIDVLTWARERAGG